jgi:pimeloyl-ACP methyl ester carboxylesterase
MSPALTTFIIQQFFFQPKKYSLSKTEKSYKEKAIPFEFMVSKKRIRGWTWGSGPPVLLVHGWNSSGLQFHKFIDPILARGYSVITYDKPAHGSSDGRHSSYFEFTDAVRYLLNLPMLSNLTGVIAHSLGAAAVINAFSKEDIFPKTVLFAPALSVKEILYDSFGRFGMPEKILTQILQVYEKKYQYSIDTDNPIYLIPRFKSNALIIHDKHDKFTSYDYSVKAAELNPTIYLHSTEGMGHGRILFDKQLIEKSVSFLLD